MKPTRISAVAALLLMACGGPQDPATEDLTASQHESEANDEDVRAAEHMQHAEPGRALYGLDVYDPADGHWAMADAHLEHAQAHRDRAQALRDYEEVECSRFSESARSACPFLLGLDTIEDVEGGARLTFADQADVAAVVDHIRCHLAFVAAQGGEDIDDCALYVPGARVERAESVVVLTTDQPDEVAELRRRVRVQTTH
jgi:hypothetical protein